MPRMKPGHLPLRSLLEMRSVAFSDCSERFFSRSKTSRGLAESCTGQSRVTKGHLEPTTPGSASMTLQHDHQLDFPKGKPQVPDKKDLVDMFVFSDLQILVARFPRVCAHAWGPRAGQPSPSITYLIL